MRTLEFAITIVSALLIMVLLLSTCGCATTEVTKNSLTYKNPEGIGLDVVGHKDTIIEGLEIRFPNGTTVRMKKYTSAANAAAVEQAGAIDSKAMEALSMAMKALMAARGIPTP